MPVKDSTGVSRKRLGFCVFNHREHGDHRGIGFRVLRFHRAGSVLSGLSVVKFFLFVPNPHRSACIAGGDHTRPRVFRAAPTLPGGRNHVMTTNQGLPSALSRKVSGKVSGEVIGSSTRWHTHSAQLQLSQLCPPFSVIPGQTTLY